MTTRDDAREIAEDLAEQIRDGDITTREGLLETMHETIDGCGRCIYTAQAREAVGEYGTRAYTDHFGEEGLTRDGDINWGAIAYCIVEEMVIEELERAGVDVNAPWDCPECGDSHDAADDAADCCADGSEDSEDDPEEDGTPAPDPVAHRVALAFARADSLAGQAYGVDETQDPEIRAMSLMRLGYVRSGDPHGWADGGRMPYATIYAEPRGGEGDCIPPADYWDRWPVLKDGSLWWEWCNPAVGHVWAD